jgi:hypothetical protein
MKKPNRAATHANTAANRLALRDAVAVLVSSAGILARHVDRLPPASRESQFAALLKAAADVETGVELLLEGGL